MWTCPQCETVNAEDHASCLACGFVRVKVVTTTGAPGVPPAGHDVGGSSPNAPAPTPSAASPRARRSPVIAVVAALVALGVGIFVGTALLGGSDPHRPGQGTKASGGSAVTTSTTTSTTVTHEVTTTTLSTQAGLQRLDQLLGQSSGARGVLGELVNRVRSCDVDSTTASQQIAGVIASRQQQLASLAAFDSGNNLQISDLVTQLTGATSASLEADRHFADWIAVVGDCTGSAPLDVNYQAGSDSSKTASADKAAFVAAYNSLAGSFGMRTWTEAQI